MLAFESANETAHKRVPEYIGHEMSIYGTAYEETIIEHSTLGIDWVGIDLLANRFSREKMKP